MKVGLLGDIHANLVALDVCLQKLVDEGCDYVMATGDIVGYGPQPRECIERLMDLEISSVRGNHDEYVLQKTPLLAINPHARYVIEWTRSQLDAHHLEYLRQLPDCIDAKDFLITHASNCRAPRWGYVLNESSAKSNFAQQNRKVCFNGHTHMPMIFSEDPNGQINITDFQDITLDKELRYLINVGSVGQPRDKEPKTTTVTFDTESLELKMFRLDYNISEVQKQMFNSKFPARLIARLEEGR
ncbi:MAG: metallophosphatase family protein [Lentisphaeraceae bacterium]|nr:metallophosphatase family protein [Lentisphaeraceae bacterium]